MIDDLVDFTDFLPTFVQLAGGAKRPGLDGVSFDVHRGEIFGFLGPNGAGKTTTLRMLMGITQPVT